MLSAYTLQIVHDPSGEVVASWKGRDPEESRLADELANRVATKGVGLGRTTDHVMADVRAAFDEMLLELKRQV